MNFKTLYKTVKGALSGLSAVSLVAFLPFSRDVNIAIGVSASAIIHAVTQMIEAKYGITNK